MLSLRQTTIICGRSSHCRVIKVGVAILEGYGTLSSSGRPYELDTITFAYQRDLDIDPVPAKASEFLINQQPLTKKGGSMLVTALNALISRHVSLNSEALISIGTNKFFPKTGYVSAGQMLNTSSRILHFDPSWPAQHSVEC